MSFSQLTNQTAHRPWPIPPSPWIMTQRWSDLVFAHWPIPADALRPLVPSSLHLDTFEGQAWIGLVPFRMSNVRPRFVPAMPWLSAFPEFNVRTYVCANNSTDPAISKPGVYFFSLEAGNPVAVSIARQVFKLPYFRANMGLQHEEEPNGWNAYSAKAIHYRTERTHLGASSAQFRGSYRPIGPTYQSEPGTLEYWLTERYALYTVPADGRVLRGDIHHLPWPLQPAELEIEFNSMAVASQIDLPDTQPLLHFAQELDVVVWPLSHKVENS
ncbi:MAG: DUF2071 domain-containing protein [Chloroflexota bacterium]